MRIDEQNNPLTPFFRDKGDGLTAQQRAAVISVQARYEAAGIPKGYRDIYLDNSPAREDQAEIYSLLESYVKTFTADDVRIKNLYLVSYSPGTGKTTTGAVLINEYIRRRFMYLASKGRTIPEVLALFMDVNDVQTRYNMASMSNDDEEMARIVADIKRYSTAPFLICDDLAVRGATESFRSLVHAVINERNTAELPTVYTSNVHISDLSSVFDARLADRIGDMAAVLQFKGSSKRGKR